MDYNKEADFIETIDPVNPGTNFNNDPQCFKTYCQMQARFAVNNRQPEAATRIRKVLADARLI